MIENFKESAEEFRDYDSELLLKILNKTSVETKTSDDKELEKIGAEYNSLESKKEDEKRRFRRSSWSCLGSILGRLGCLLGVVFLILAGVSQQFLKNHVF